MEGSNWQNNGMGNMAMGKCEEWQRESFHNETKCKHFQGWYGGLQFGNVYTCNGFFQKTCKFRKPIPKNFFTSLLNKLLTKDLLKIGNLLSIEFMNPRWWLYSTLGKWVWVPQELRNKVLKQPVNCRMIRLAIKPTRRVRQ